MSIYSPEVKELIGMTCPKFVDCNHGPRLGTLWRRPWWAVDLLTPPTAISPKASWRRGGLDSIGSSLWGGCGYKETWGENYSNFHIEFRKNPIGGEVVREILLFQGHIGAVLWFGQMKPQKRGLHPGRLTWNLRLHHWKREIIFQNSIFRFYVKIFRGV